MSKNFNGIIYVNGGGSSGRGGGIGKAVGMLHFIFYFTFICVFHFIFIIFFIEAERVFIYIFICLDVRLSIKKEAHEEAWQGSEACEEGEEWEVSRKTFFPLGNSQLEKVEATVAVAIDSVCVE